VEIVTPGLVPRLVPAIHVFTAAVKAWMAGTTAMTI
jgi:hypothetical protein